jgi:uncharacterized protein YidB (DUF937 family)
MGLLDVLNGMQNGPRGQKNPADAKSGGMSPIMMAILGLLAYKAMKGLGGSSAAPASPTPTPLPQANQGGGIGDLLRNVLGGDATPGSSSPRQGGQNQPNSGELGGLGGLLTGGLGGLLAGGAAGSVLSGALGDLLNQFKDAGQHDVAKSWVGTGSNQEIAPDDLAKALGSDQVDTLMAQSGLSRDELLSGLSQYLPQVVNELTPNGRLPTEHEVSRMI